MWFLARKSGVKFFGHAFVSRSGLTGPNSVVPIFVLS